MALLNASSGSSSRLNVIEKDGLTVQHRLENILLIYYVATHTTTDQVLDWTGYGQECHAWNYVYDKMVEKGP